MKTLFKLSVLLFGLCLYSCSSDDNPTCNDGIQNGTETAVDCGGECQECFSFIGFWEIRRLELNGSNFLEEFGILGAYYDFIDNNNLKSITIQSDGKINISDNSYNFNISQSIITIDDISFTISNSNVVQYELFGTDANNNEIRISMRKTRNDLCSAITCSNGSCEYGVCTCEMGWEGDRCDDLTLPDRIFINKIRLESFLFAFGSLDQDKYQPSNVESISDFYLVFKDSFGNAVKTTNVIRNSVCNPALPCVYQVEYTFEIDQLYTVEYFDEDSFEGQSEDDRINTVTELDFQEILRFYNSTPEELAEYDNTEQIIRISTEVFDSGATSSGFSRVDFILVDFRLE